MCEPVKKTCVNCAGYDHHPDGRIDWRHFEYNCPRYKIWQRNAERISNDDPFREPYPSVERPCLMWKLKHW